MLQHLPPNNKDMNLHLSNTTNSNNSSPDIKTLKSLSGNSRNSMKSKILTPSSELFNLDNTHSNDNNTNGNKNDNNNNNNNNNPTANIDIDKSSSFNNNSSVIDSPNTLSSTPNSNLTNSSRRFSFNKRPVSKSLKIQRKSSQISFIHNYPAQRCDSINKDIDHSKFYLKYKGIMKDKDELPENVINDLSFEYNYDEKIRAPRMSIASLISKDSNFNLHNNNNTSINPKIVRQNSAPAIFKINSNSSSNKTLDSLPEESNDNNNYSYKPASYDLSQKLRKISVSNDENNDENYTNNIDSSFNFNQGKKSFNRESSKTSPKKDIYSDDFKDDRKQVKQIDEPMKLLNNYVPPVLRPIQPSTFNCQKEVESHLGNFNISQYNQKRTENKTSLSEHPNDSYPLLNNDTDNNKKNTQLSLNSSPSSCLNPNQKNPKLSKLQSQLIVQLRNKNTIENQQPNISENLNSITSSISNSNSNSTISNDLLFIKTNKYFEPSHSHWKPNSTVDSCEACNTNFNLFRRKHHCRHCGGIFCSKCLQNYSNLNLLSHFEKPDNIKNIPNISSLLPIKSNETIETSTTINSTKTNSTYTQNSNHILNYNKSNNYSSFCKVCPSCFEQWLIFLDSDEDYEGKNKNLDYHDLENDNLNNSNSRKDSIAGVPSDWNWSSF